MISPRPYQIDCIDSVLDRLSKGVTRQLLSMPTGTGKTVIFSLAAKHFQRRTLILAHRDELLTQARDKMEMIWPETSVGIVRAELDEVDAHVVIASVQTVCRDRRLKSIAGQGFDLMIIDEAHHATAPSYQRIVSELGFMNGDPRKLLLGLTATPRRSDGVGLGAIFEEISFTRSISTMIRSGYLSPLVGRRIVTRTDLRGVGMARGDFISGQLSRAINTPERNSLIVEKFQEFAEDRKKVIIFCADVQHSKDLAEAFSQNGIKAAPVFGEMAREERKRILQEFSDGKTRVLTNCAVLTEGYDEEAIDCVILGRPTASEGLYMQMIGRGTRTHPMKRDCLILDFCDNSTRHNLCNFKNSLDGAISSLDEQESDEINRECDQTCDDEIGENNDFAGAKIFAERIEDIEFFGRSEFAWVPVGNSWHLSLAKDRDVWVHRDVDGFRVLAHLDNVIITLCDTPLPLSYAMGTAEDWARSQTAHEAWIRKDAFWRSKPATRKQIETLKRFGISITPSMTCGDASILLDRKINEPATDKQCYWLCTNGATFDPSITKSQATQLISVLRRYRDG